MSLWAFAGRVALSASYLTLAVTDHAAAAALAVPFAACVLCVALADIVTFWRRA